MAHRGTHTPPSVAARAAALLLSAFVLLAASPPRVLAQDADTPLQRDDLGVTVTAGYGGTVVPGRWIPVEVHLAPRIPVAGVLAVVTQGDNGTQAEGRRVEVAAGGAEVHRFVVPPSHDASVELRLGQGGDDGSGQTMRFAVRSGDGAGYQVGLLAERLPSAVPNITAFALQARASTAAVAPAWLDRSAEALDPLATLIAPATTLRSLDDTAVERLRAAVARGLDLVVIADADGPIDVPLPADWLPADSATSAQITSPDGLTAAARTVTPVAGAWPVSPADLGADGSTAPVAAAVAAGRGRVVVTGVAFGDGPMGVDGGFWGLLAQPSGITQQHGSAGTTRIFHNAPETLRGGGIDIPPLWLLAGFLGAYVLAVGPVNALVLSRIRRQQLAWVTVPAITLVFASAAWLGAGGGAPSLGLSSRAAWWMDGGAGEVVTAAVRAPRAGAHTIDLPGAGWAVIGTGYNRRAEVERDGDRTTLELQLEALEVGTALAQRSLDAPPPMTVEMTALPGGLAFSVTNTTSVTIDDVTVRAATRSVPLGALAPGETREDSFELGQSLPISQAFGDDFEGLRGPDGTVTGPQALQVLLRWSLLDGAPGTVWVTGIPSEDLGLGTIGADGKATTSQGTLVAVGTRMPAGDDGASVFAIGRQPVVAGFGDVWQPGPLTIEGRTEAVLRFRVPHTTALAAGDAVLQSDLERGMLNDGGPGFRELCFTQEVRDQDGNLLAAGEACGDPDFPPMPPCPDVQCEFDGRETLEICDADGECRKATVTIPDLEQLPDLPEQRGLEVFDVIGRAWIPLAEAFPDGVGEPDRLLSPLGELYVRVSGELHPFDFSGRGVSLGPRPGGAA